MSIKIKRGAETSNFWSGDGANGQILQMETYVAIRGRINYGQGGTEVEFQIGSEDFYDLAIAMIAVDKITAIKAFGQALVDGVD